MLFKQRLGFTLVVAGLAPPFIHQYPRIRGAPSPDYLSPQQAHSRFGRLNKDWPPVDLGVATRWKIPDCPLKPRPIRTLMRSKLYQVYGHRGPKESKPLEANIGLYYHHTVFEFHGVFCHIKKM